MDARDLIKLRDRVSSCIDRANEEIESTITQIRVTVEIDESSKCVIEMLREQQRANSSTKDMVRQIIHDIQSGIPVTKERMAQWPSL